MDASSDAVSIAWNEQHDTVIVSLKKSDRLSVDAYIEANLTLLTQCSGRNTIYKIQDFSQNNVTVTPYLKKRLQDIYAYVRRNNMDVRVAVVLGTSVPGYVLTLISRVSAITSRNLTQRFFTTLTDAHAWVEAEKHASRSS